MLPPSTTIERFFLAGCRIAHFSVVKWNGTKLTDAETMLEWAKQRTWKALHPVVELSRNVYKKGISLGKAAMQAVEARLKRDPTLPKYDILINPASTA